MSTHHQDSEQLPVNMARPMAFISVLMSVGFVVLIYFVALMPLFAAPMRWLVFPVMLVLALLSSYMALRNVRKKICCPHCQQLFFFQVMTMFLPPKQCAHCQRPATEP